RSRSDFELVLERWFTEEERSGRTADLFGPRSPKRACGEYVVSDDLQKLLREELRRRVTPNAIAATMRLLGFQSAISKIHKKATWLWWRGTWQQNGDGMVRHVCTDTGRHMLRNPLAMPPTPPV